MSTHAGARHQLLTHSKATTRRNVRRAATRSANPSMILAPVGVYITSQKLNQSADTYKTNPKVVQWSGDR